MATVTKPIALDESFHTTEQNPRNIADVLLEGLSHITGRTASEVEYDNTDSGLTADNVQDALDEIAESVPTLPTTDIQTAVDEFETYNGGLLSECKVALSPNQDLHGYDSPWVGGAGKNLLFMTVDSIKANNTISTWSGNAYTIDGVKFEILADNADNVLGIKVTRVSASSNNVVFNITNGSELSGLNGKSLIINDSGTGASVDMFTQFYLYDGTNVISPPIGGDSSVFTATPSASSKFRIVVRTASNPNGVTFVPMIRLSSVTDATFAPYSNICPISGHTQVEVGDDGKNLFVPTDIISGMRLTNITGTAYNSTQDVIAESNSFVSSLIKVTQGNIVTKNSPNEDAYHRWHIYDGNGICVRYTSDNVITIGSGESYVALCGADSEINTTQIRQGYQVTVNLGGTYYSGTLDVVSGVLTVDKTGVEYDGSSDEGWTIAPSDVNAYFYCNASDMTSTAWKYIWSESFKTIQVNTDRSIENTIWGIYQQIHIHASSAITPSGATSIGLAEFKTWLSNNPQKVVYELATPQTIQLSPTMVKALVGENHLSAPLDGQEITESQYKQAFTFDDVITYIQSLS